MRITLHPGAERDVAEAAEFYEREASPILAGRFIVEFRRVTRVLQENPGIGSPRANGRRSFPMQVFPYVLIYRPLDGAIRILVVRHHRRHPSYGEFRK